jgi:hypothetical protein
VNNPRVFMVLRWYNVTVMPESPSCRIHVIGRHYFA